MSPNKTSFNASRGTIFKFSPNELVIIGLDTDDGPEHELWDARINEPEDSDALQALARNIATRGVLQPIVVRKDGNKAQVVAGRRRVRAARIANATILADSKNMVLVPAQRRQGDALDMVGALVSENEHRQADAFLERATKALKMRTLGANMKEVAEAFNVQTAAVRRWFRVLELDEEILQAIRDGGIAPYAAMELSTLPREQQLEAFHMAMKGCEIQQPVVQATEGGDEGSSGPQGSSEGSEPGETTPQQPEAPKGPTAAEIKAAKKQVQKGGDAPKTKPPKKRPVKLLRDVAEKISEVMEAGEELDLHPQAIAMLEWVIGTKTELDVEGLSGLLESLTASS